MGLRPTDTADVLRLGYQAWLQDQVFYEGIDDSAVDATIASRYPLLSQTPAQLVNANQGTLQNQLQEATIHRAAFSRRQLYERMVEFWSDHFNISIAKVGYLKAVDDRDVIRKHALGKFSDLLKASAHSPAMLAYLDQNTSRVGAPNQNYARELMELHTLGVDGGYTQARRRRAVARASPGGRFTGAAATSVFDRRTGTTSRQKIVLGVTIPAAASSTGCSRQLRKANRCSTCSSSIRARRKFISTKMLKWLLDAGADADAGPHRSRPCSARRGGDIKSMVRAILNEAWLTAAPHEVQAAVPLPRLGAARDAADGDVARRT